MKVLVDTNVLLEFYRNQKDRLSTLDDLAKAGKSVVFPEQVLREFRRNREGLIDEYLKSAQPPSAPITPGFLATAPEQKEALEAHKNYKASLAKLTKVVGDRKANPASDLVAEKVEHLYGVSEQLSTPDSLIDRARLRRLRGDPPMSPEKKSVGDEIIWEVVLENVKDDLVIVSRDTTFTENEAFLAQEFKARTGKTLEVVASISVAQTKLGRPKEEAGRADDAEKEAKAAPRPSVPEHLFTGIPCPFCNHPTLGSGGASNVCGLCGRASDSD